MNLLGTKILTLFILGAVSFLTGLTTIPISKKVLSLSNGEARGRQKIITSFLLCFGGGVLLSTTMLHILPEVSEVLQGPGEEMEIHFLPQLVLCSGFFLIYLIEELVELVLDKMNNKDVLHRTVSTTRTYGTSKVGNSDAMEMNGDHCNNTHNDMEIQENKDHPVEKQKSSGAFKDFFTIVALSVHAIFEGMAVGLEESTKDVWTLFIAIASHKFVIAFCICMELQNTGAKKLLFFTYLTVFSLVSSLGIGIGTIITETGGENISDITVATLQGISAGTLLYVVMFEILNRERVKNVSGLLQFSGIILGFVVMMIIDIFAHHEHEHEGEGEDGHAHALMSVLSGSRSF